MFAASLTALVTESATVAAGDYGPDSDRFRAMVAALFALSSVALGALALARVRRFDRGNVPASAVAALILGLTGAVVGVVHLADSQGGFGTGNGRAGAIVALLIAQVGINLGGVALARSRRTLRPHPAQTAELSSLESGRQFPGRSRRA